MTAADAPRRAVLLIDAPEEQGSWAVGQKRHPAGESGHVVEVRIPGSNEVRQQPLCSLTHRSQRLESVIQGCLFGCNLGIGRGSGGTHEAWDSPKPRAKAPAQKSPDIPGTVLDLDLQNNSLSWYFAFSSVRTLNV